MFEMRSMCSFFSCVAKLAGVTYVMMKSSTPELDIWLS